MNMPPNMQMVMYGCGPMEPTFPDATKKYGPPIVAPPRGTADIVGAARNRLAEVERLLEAHDELVKEREILRRMIEASELHSTR